MRKLIMWISIIAVIALAVLNLTYKDRIEPDAVYPMTNSKIEWHYAGK